MLGGALGLDVLFGKGKGIKKKKVLVFSQG